MSTRDTQGTPKVSFKQGDQCLVLVGDKRFLSAVLHVSLETVRVSFPIRDYPVEGMWVALEFHDQRGYTRYETEVIEPPTLEVDGLLLEMPREMSRHDHRNFWRVRTDMPVELKSHVHPRHHEAKVLDLSAGGMLAECKANFEMGELVEIKYSLPGSSLEVLTGQIVHFVPGGGDKGLNLFGLSFVNPDPVLTAEISKYIWRRVRELHREEFRSRPA